MEKMNALTLIITLVVGVILTGALLGPVISDATKTEETFKNEGYYTMTYSEADALTFSWDCTAPNVATINGNEVPLITPPQYTPVNVVCGDDWFLRWTGDTMQFYSVAGGNNPALSASVASETSLTLVASSGSATIQNTAATPVSQTVDYTFMYVVDPNGSLVMKDSAKSVYLLGDSEIYAIGRTSTTGLLLKIKITGNINDGFNAEVLGTPSSTVTLGDVEATMQKMDEYVNLYSLQDLKIPVGYDDSEYTATYSYFIAPASVTAELSNHLTPGQISLMGAIPVMVIVALLMAAVGAIALRRAD